MGLIPAFYGYAIIVSAVLFIVLVTVLTLQISGYDSRYQLMSELALGPATFFAPCMFFAFLSLAFPFVVLIGVLHRLAGNKSACMVPGLAACAFAGAGVFPLGTATELHVALVGVAFIASGLAMYGLPAGAGPFAGAHWRLFSRALLVLLAVSVALGHSLIPIGIAQRLAAAVLLAWFIGMGVRLIRFPAGAQ